MKQVFLFIYVILITGSGAYSQCITVPPTVDSLVIPTIWSYPSQATTTGVEQGESATFGDGGNFGGYQFIETNGRWTWQTLNATRDLKTIFGTSVIMDIVDGNTNAYPGSEGGLPPFGIGVDTFMLFNYGGSFSDDGFNMRSTTSTIIDPAYRPGKPKSMNLNYTLYAAGNNVNHTAAGLYFVANFGNVIINTSKPVFFKNTDLQIVGTSTWTQGIVYPSGLNNGIPAKVRFGGNENDGNPTPVASSPAGTSATAFVNGLVSLDSFAVAVTDFVLPTGDGCGTKYAPFTVSTAANTVINAEYNYMPPPPLGTPDPLIISATERLVAVAVSPVASYQVDGASVPNLSGNHTDIATNATNKTTATNASISVPYDLNLWGNIIPAVTPNELVLMGYTGTKWVILPTTGGTTGLAAGTLKAAGVDLTLFTKISVGVVNHINNAMLPVTLIDFNANKQNTTALLTWETASELNTSYFSIERSKDGINYSSIGSVTAAGNSNDVLDYSFVDQNPATGSNYYRLRIVDKDARFTYSAVKILNYDNATAVIAYPNPAKDRLTVTGLDAGMQLRLISMEGQVLSAATASSNTMSMDMIKVPAGAYILQVIKKDGVVKNIKVLKK